MFVCFLANSLEERQACSDLLESFIVETESSFLHSAFGFIEFNNLSLAPR